MYSSNPEVSHHVCRCATGYEKGYSNGKEKCIRVYRTTVYEKNAKILHFFGNGDSVPIIMSCLAAFLALFACFAGIFQFLRRKQTSRSSLRCGDPQHPQEVVTLNGSTPTQPYPSSDMSPSRTPDSLEFAPNSTIADSFIPVEACQNDFPPSYEEVVNSTKVTTIQEEEEDEDEIENDRDVATPRGQNAIRQNI
ncbi:uncharacterized protein LOC111619096 [Centruroides sculpturatus]|uniref:uncharacterized protein LOC111619096 n=1 Tax=Centruroides sculpturatus TaxID=218467 RepID=UPI000C6DA81C|nr:uncharacterized protein LOC111619096 [Centruroides sculpturatus]